MHNIVLWVILYIISFIQTVIYDTAFNNKNFSYTDYGNFVSTHKCLLLSDNWIFSSRSHTGTCWEM